MRTPTWAEIEKFCRVDGWDPIDVGRSVDHRYYRKVLADRKVLETRVSHASPKTMSWGRWRAILRDQLRVDEAVFWQALRSGDPVPRPGAMEEAPAQIPAGIHRVLRDRLYMTDEEIAKLSVDEAVRLAQGVWS